MTLLHLILTAFVLLAQAWPAQAALSGVDDAACGGGCCTWLAEAGMSACACTDVPAPASPASTPPAASRDLVPQVTWVSVSEANVPPPEARSLQGATWHRAVLDEKTRPHVRLAVLFCSLLN